MTLRFVGCIPNLHHLGICKVLIVYNSPSCTFSSKGYVVSVEKTIGIVVTVVLTIHNMHSPFVRMSYTVIPFRVMELARVDPPDKSFFLSLLFSGGGEKISSPLEKLKTENS